MAGQDQAPKAVGQETTISDIEQAREDLARTIDAIADKVRPANVARRYRGQAQAARRSQSDPRLAGAGAVVVVGGGRAPGLAPPPLSRPGLASLPPGGRPIVTRPAVSRCPW